jgi:hypothetical protein
MYRFENDSLVGFAKINGAEELQRMKIALQDIGWIRDILMEIPKEKNTMTPNQDLTVITKQHTLSYGHSGVITRGSAQYSFEANMYRFIGDSIDGLATIEADHNLHVRLALKDIVSIKDRYSRFELTDDMTNIVILAVVGGLVVLAVLAWYFVAEGGVDTGF